MRARHYSSIKTQRALAQATSNLSSINPGYGVIALSHNRILTSHRNVPVAAGYGQVDETTDMSPAAAVALGVGGLILTGVLVIGGYVLLAYGVGWGASKGWQKAKKKRK